MAITVTKLAGPGVIGGYGQVVDFQLTIGATGWLAAGNAVDLTDYFSEITSIKIGGAEVISGYKFGFIVPDHEVTVTASNVLLTAHYSTDAAGAMTPVPNDTDLSGVTALRISVVGKVAADAY